MTFDGRALVVVRKAGKSRIRKERREISGTGLIPFGQIMLSTPLHENCCRVKPPAPLDAVVEGSYMAGMATLPLSADVNPPFFMAGVSRL